MKEIAIIGPTASGKSALAVEIAQQYHACVLSLDSLSLYKHIDIISAKPDQEEMGGIPHFGIDLIEPDEAFNAVDFIRLYETTKTRCQREDKNLIIVGGSSFYLKMLMDGLSHEPVYSDETKEKVRKVLTDIGEAYRLITTIDPQIAGCIAPNDRYRIEKALLVYFETGVSLTEFRALHDKQATDHAIKIFEIEVERELLRERIVRRTALMLQKGAVDEAAWLERRYTRAPKPMGSIGIKEILEYLDGKISREMLPELISTHTAQFAKRQNTFNRNQFSDVTRLPLALLKTEISRYFES